MNLEYAVCLEGLALSPLPPSPPPQHQASLSLTQQSTVPCLPYSGDILDTDDGGEVPLWAEDKWSESRVQEAQSRIEQQGDAVSDYWRKNYEDRGSAYWHAFYKRNTDNFYKDRHYIHVVFPELDPSNRVSAPDSPVHLLEVGSGVGNAVLPLLEIDPQLHVQAIDCARSAIQILNQHNHVKSGRLRADVVDITRQELPIAPSPAGFDFSLCMFVLSALPPRTHQEVFHKLSGCLRVGGRLLLRDYARYDEAQLRFAKGSKLGENFYVRQDGTCAYFFSEEELRALAETAGLQVEECYYIQRQYANRKQQKARYRVWLHAKFVKLQP